MRDSTICQLQNISITTTLLASNSVANPTMTTTNTVPRNTNHHMNVVRLCLWNSSVWFQIWSENYCTWRKTICSQRTLHKVAKSILETYFSFLYTTTIPDHESYCSGIDGRNYTQWLMEKRNFRQGSCINNAHIPQRSSS